MKWYRLNRGISDLCNKIRLYINEYGSGKPEKLNSLRERPSVEKEGLSNTPINHNVYNSLLPVQSNCNDSFCVSVLLVLPLALVLTIVNAVMKKDF